MGKAFVCTLIYFATLTILIMAVNIFMHYPPLMEQNLNGLIGASSAFFLGHSIGQKHDQK